MLEGLFHAHPALAIGLIGLAASVIASLVKARADPMPDAIGKADWESIQKLSAIIAFLGFLIQIAQWVYSYLF
jgi:hypothetical protein